MDGKLWDCSCNMSKSALYNFLYALIMCHGTITSTYTMGHQYTPRQNAHNTAWFRIKLPKNFEVDFRKMTGIKLEEPKEVHI